MNKEIEYICQQHNIEKDEIYIFINKLNYGIQKLSLTKEEAIRIIESLYK